MQSCDSFVRMTVGNNDPLAPKVSYSQHVLCGQNSWSQIKMLQKTRKVMANIFQACVKYTLHFIPAPEDWPHGSIF